MAVVGAGALSDRFTFPAILYAVLWSNALWIPVAVVLFHVRSWASIVLYLLFGVASPFIGACLAGAATLFGLPYVVGMFLEHRVSVMLVGTATGFLVWVFCSGWVISTERLSSR